MCGGTDPFRAGRLPRPGLSPRVRGNRDRGGCRFSPSGSIPACAGEPRRTCSPCPRPRVYPRVCGGTTAIRSQGIRLEGLSPRVRGNPLEVLTLRAPVGSIPACAGEPIHARVIREWEQVYPRVCGGTSETIGLLAILVGLSPRVRGNPPSPCSSRPPDGSIPACAGEPLGRALRICLPKVYPRVCGGTQLRERVRSVKQGLSPRVRGNRPEHVGPEPISGSIPACAGEPRTTRSRGTGCRVYPRVCGGTPEEAAASAYTEGLSPRVRGNLDHAPRRELPRGSIPACAGEPRISGAMIRSRRVYPRVCGGTHRRTARTLPRAGLSPRVRGNLDDVLAVLRRLGSIPACAGEPMC